MLLLLPLLLAGCDAGTWCERFNLACELEGEVEREELVDADGDVWIAGEDCDDTDPYVHPSAEEICDGEDNNCDGVVDEGTPGVQTWYLDEDSDDYGDPDHTLESCEQPNQYVLEGGDCNDANPYQHPGRSEVCDNGVDDDCDGSAAGCHLLGDYQDEEAWLQLAAPVGGSALGSVLLTTPADDASGRPALWTAGPQAGLGGTGRGAVYGFTGYYDALSPGGYLSAVEADLELRGSIDSGSLGTGLAGGVDLDGDGGHDLVVGVPGGGPDGVGLAMLFLLRHTAEGQLSRDQAGAVFAGSTPGQRLGSALALSTALDEDGLPAVVIGMPGADDGAGQVALFVDELDGGLEPGDAWLRLDGPQDGAAVGSVLALSDLDGDGLDDLVLAAPDLDEGRIWVHFAPFPTGTGLAEEAPTTLVGESDGDQAGAALGVGGDLDGDGIGDLLVGGPGFDGEADEAGCAWVLLGGQTLDRNTGLRSLADASARIDGIEADGRAGSAVALDGDADGDGRADMLLGAPGVDLDEGGEGVAYLVLSGLLASRALSAPTATFLGPEPDGATGSALAFLDDSDGNGLDEVVIGAPGVYGDGRVSVFVPQTW